MHARKRRLTAVLCGALLLGLTYAAFCNATGLRIPCLLHEITGLYCPGCGVTRMCLALLHLDFAAALRYNQLIFCLLPVFLVLLIQLARQYLQAGNATLTRRQNAVIWGLIILLLLFGVLRNLPPFAALRPHT